jgi:hypothetical protein
MREYGIPILMVVGEKEEQTESVSIRYRNGEQRIFSIAEAADLFRADAFR